MDAIAVFFNLLIPILELAILGRVILSFIDPGGQWTVSRILTEVTDPILKPIRSIVPNLGMLDLSPLIAYLLLSMLQQVVTSAAS